ncbi:MAG: Hpt domain-containing protein, partial [Raoultibacter sp.]
DNQVEDMISCGIDYRGGVDRFGGNAALYEKFIFRYLDDDHFNQLVQAINSDNAEEGFRVAHTLKGVVGNLSFSEFFTVLDPATEALRNGDVDEARSS